MFDIRLPSECDRVHTAPAEAAGSERDRSLSALRLNANVSVTPPLFAGDSVAVAVEVGSVSGVASANGCGTGFAGGRAVLEVGRRVR